MTVIRHSDTRRTETPSGVMTTLASPTQGGSQLALWRVDVPADTTGPLHFIDTEQIWTVLAGRIDVAIDGTELTAAEGDTVILPPNVLRQVSTAGGFTAIVTAPAGARAGRPDSDGTIVPPWIA
ncbi:cupin domain-containing protein [Nocardia abscessus]|uniref:cupin domain-containing protein n=1 Tax=Nocardia abscessus TaxID=120957 RepID=UPI0024544AAE|nr:cupin domain-containing protein [Nocardia abscessus]